MEYFLSENSVINLFANKKFSKINKYCFFTKNENIPNFEILCFVYDKSHFNNFIKNYDYNYFLDTLDYTNDNIIIINFDNILVGFVYVFDDNKKMSPTVNKNIFFWLNIKQFVGLKHLILFRPKNDKANSLVKPYLNFFPYLFGEKDKIIEYHNKIYDSYYRTLFYILQVSPLLYNYRTKLYIIDYDSIINNININFYKYMLYKR
jgi:hypothetical protein